MSTLYKNRVALISALSHTKKYYSKYILNDIIKKIKEDKDGHYVSFEFASSSLMISFAKNCDKSKEKEKRATTTLGRYIRRQLRFDEYIINDNVLDGICKRVSSELLTTDVIESNIEILSGNDIKEFYKKTDTYSCMTKENAWKTSLYALNPDKVKLVTYGGYVRALLWTCDDGTVVLDRIYPSGCVEVELVKKWAEKNNYVCRSNSSGRPVSNYDEPLTDGKSHSITLKYGNSFPYMDTFKVVGNLSTRNNTVVVTNNYKWFDKWNERDNWLAVSVSGCLPWGGTPSKVCANCHGSFFVDSMTEHEGGYYCQDCAHTCLRQCDVCHKKMLRSLLVVDGYKYTCRHCLDKKKEQAHCGRCGITLTDQTGKYQVFAYFVCSCCYYSIKNYDHNRNEILFYNSTDNYYDDY